MQQVLVAIAGITLLLTFLVLLVGAGNNPGGLVLANVFLTIAATTLVMSYVVDIPTELLLDNKMKTMIGVIVGVVLWVIAANIYSYSAILTVILSLLGSALFGGSVGLRIREDFPLKL